MICNGEPPSKELSKKFRDFAEKHGFPKIARCKICNNDSKQFSHMSIMELKPFWDFKLGRQNYKYVGICLNCVIESGIQYKSIVNISPINPS